MKIINPNEIVYLKNDKSYTNIIELWYLVDDDKSSIAYRSIIPKLLLNTSLKYNDEISMEKAYLKYYILNIFCEYIIVGNKKFLYFRLNVPQKTKIKEFNIKESLNLFLDTIYYPNVKNDCFVKFDEKIEMLKQNINHIEKSKKALAMQNIFKILDTDEYLSKNLYHNREQLNKITSKETYNYYKKIIEKKPLIFLYGNDELLECKNILEEYFLPYKSENIELKKDNHFFKPCKKVKTIEVVKDYNQSFLVLVYKIDGMKEKDKILLNIITKILISNPTRLLFNKLRIENNLVYSASAESYGNEGLLFIYCDIYKESKEQTLKCIEELFNDLKNDDKLNKLLDKIKTNNEINYIRNLDNKYYIFNEKVFDYLKVVRTNKKIIKEQSKINSKDLKMFLDRIKLDLIYFVKGDSNE